MKRLVVGLALCALAGVVQASTDSVTLQVSAPSNTLPGLVRVTIRNRVVPVPIPPGTTATAKRDLIEGALAAAGYLVSDDGPAGSSVTVLGLTSLDRVRFETSDSGEVLDTLRHSTCGRGTVGFANVHFEPFDSLAQPAVFTGGIVTDVGVLSAQISAQELNFQTDGPIICQALFQRLAPRAPQYGAQINYAGDRLEVYFDPAYTVTQGGIIFGTSSPTPGCTGTVKSQELERTLELELDDSTNVTPAVLRVIIEGEGARTVDVQVPPLVPAPTLRDRVKDALNAGGVPALPDPLPTVVKALSLSPSCLVTVLPQGSGLASLQLAGPTCAGGRIFFTGHFDPFDPALQPAVFTGGIVTDVGTLSTQISAQELNFQTDGPIICQALFQRLAPRAPQYGAQINYAGDRLEVYFDPAYTVTQGGIIFGTTSPSPTCGATLFYPSKNLKR